MDNPNYSFANLEQLYIDRIIKKFNIDETHKSDAFSSRIIFEIRSAQMIKKVLIVFAIFGKLQISMLVIWFGYIIWTKFEQNLDVDDKSRHQHRELGINIRYQSPTSYSGVLWCWWPMLVPQDLFKDGKRSLNLAPGWISCLQHNISVTNITFWHIMMLVTD